MALSFIKDFRLPDNQYNKGNFKKTGICVHHTAGGSAKSTFNWWEEDLRKIGTAYIIDHDGSLLEVFEPESWAWQFGLNWGDPDRINFERRYIGIELASEGTLIKKNGKYYCYGRIDSDYEKPKDEVFDAGKDYRGYRYFDRYEPEQIETLTELINHLCDKFGIARKMLANPLQYYGKEIKDFEGIIGHVNVRKDKTDPAPMPELWDTLRNDCNLTVEGSRPKPVKAGSNNSMSAQEIESLFRHNVEEINKMNVSAGSMVKGLTMELERDGRDTYIKLHDAEPRGHIIHYDFVEGDQTLVKKIADALGFKQITQNKLEVYHA